MNEVLSTWRRQPNSLLTLSTGIHLLVLVIAAAGLALDPRLITGAPAWLKPAKFAVSGAIYLVTIAWLLPMISWRPRLAGLMGRVIAVALFIEIGAISMQAARGEVSHFNLATPFDTVVFRVMAISIAVLLIASATLAFALFRTTFDDAAWGWALRWGLTITVAGSGLGGLMTVPTREQQAGIESGTNPTRVGQHTVGGPDGGPGLPLVKWSTEHGDQRIPHFIALHAVQILPLTVWFLRRRRRNWDASLSHAVAASYAGLFALALSQALRGQPLLSPDSFTLELLAAWAAFSLAAVGVAWSSAQRTGVAPMLQTWGRS